MVERRFALRRSFTIPLVVGYGKYNIANSLAVSNEINALAATPAVLPSFKPPRRNSRRSQSAPGERRAIVRHSRRGSPRRPSLVGYHEFCFSGRRISRALRSPRTHRPSARRPPWGVHAATVKRTGAVTARIFRGRLHRRRERVNILKIQTETQTWRA